MSQRMRAWATTVVRAVALSLCSATFGCTVAADDEQSEDVEFVEAGVKGIANTWWINRAPNGTEWLDLYLYNDGDERRFRLHYYEAQQGGTEGLVNLIGHPTSFVDGIIHQRKGVWSVKKVEGGRRLDLDSGDDFSFMWFTIKSNKILLQDAYLDESHGQAPPAMVVRKHPCQTDTWECDPNVGCDNQCKDPQLHVIN